MRRLRRSKSSGNVSTPAPTFPTGLVRKFASQKKPKTLAVSPASIALSIGSEVTNTSGPSNDDDSSRGRVSGWQTAYAAARMAVEITKESSDMFPPLKTVVGAISVLIQNCDVGVSFSLIEHSCNIPPLPLQRTADNAGAVKDIDQRVRSLAGLLAAPVGEDDYAEKARRMELRRFVLARARVVSWFTLS